MKNLEIERKFLIDLNDIPYNLEDMERKEIEQGYILHNPVIRVRAVSDLEYYMTFKSNIDDGLVRNEVEFKISKDAYNKLMSRNDINRIHKNRYITIENENKFEIDVFEGELKGLACLEVEFDNIEDANNFKVPSWVKKEVTGDVRYTNSELAKNINNIEELI